MIEQIQSWMRASECRCRRNVFEGPVWTSTGGPEAMNQLGKVCLQTFVLVNLLELHARVLIKPKLRCSALFLMIYIHV
jgi:hypothetical protein